MEDSLSLPRPRSLPSLTEQTYEIIQTAILSLELKPGERLSVQRLSEQLGVSRTPVKDALLMLEQDSLVSIVPQRGTFVSDVTSEDAEEILELRILLEGYSAGQAAGLLSLEELEQAEAILKRMQEALDEGSYFESATIGNEFHKLLLSKLTNCRLINFLQQLDIQYTRIRYYLAQLIRRHSNSLNEHHRVLAALKARDAEQAAVAMTDHLSSVRDDMLSLMLSQGWAEGTLAAAGRENRVERIDGR